MDKKYDYDSEMRKEERRGTIGKVLAVIIILFVGGYFVVTNWEKTETATVEETVLADTTETPEVVPVIKEVDENLRRNVYAQLVDWNHADSILTELMKEQVKLEINAFIARQQVEFAQCPDSLTEKLTTQIHQIEYELTKALIDNPELPVIVTGVNIEWLGKQKTVKNEKNTQSN